jgi:nucleotide-binding universal stress UspA family protein
MKTTAYLPLLTYPDTVSVKAAAAAAKMAAAIGADLDVMIYSVDLPRSSASFGGMVINLSDMIRKVENDSREHSAGLAAAVQDMARSHGLAFQLDQRHAVPAEAIQGAVAEARYRDLAIVPWSEDNLTSRELAEALIFGAGRPVLLVPETHEAVAISHVAVAWDGSRVAARALADARPFLAAGARVTVLMAGDEKKLEAGIGDLLVDSLSRRGVTAAVRTVSAKDRPVAQALQDACGEVGAGLLVMGGYGHSRLRDFVVGGATQGVLAATTMPVLMSH